MPSPCAQFRKDLRHPQKPSSGRRLRRGQRFFRNWALGNDAAGTHNSAGLPNLHGEFTLWKTFLADSETHANGVFKKISGSQAYTTGQEGHTPYKGFDFDASRSNKIYGSSDTVMPASINQPTIIYLGSPA